MQRDPCRTPLFSVISAAGLAVLLAAGLILALAVIARAQTSPPGPAAVEEISVGGNETSEGEDTSPLQVAPDAGPDAAPEYYGKPGVITWTFAAGHEGWWSWHTTWDQDPWANGAIHSKLTNRNFTISNWVDRMQFAAIHDNIPSQSWLLAGDKGELSFTHARTGALADVLYSACLQSTGPDPYHPIFLNKPYNAICTAWRPMQTGAVHLPLVADGTWQLVYLETKFFPPYAGTPVTETLMMDILKDVHYLIIYYTPTGALCPSPRTDCLKEGDISLDNVRLELIEAEGKIGVSSPYVMDGDAVLFYATVKGKDDAIVRGSREVTMTLGDDPAGWPLYDEDAPADLRGGDGVYSRWLRPAGAGPQKAKLFYQGMELASTTITLTQHPQLVVLTDVKALYDAFLATGAAVDEDQDGNDEIDYYQMLGRLAEYAAQYKGMMYDVRENINAQHGFPVNYADLEFAGDDPATNRIRMAKLIDEALTGLHRDSGHTIGDIAIIGADDVIPFYRIKDTSARRIRLDAGVDTPTAVDLAAGYIMTDVPYGTVDYVNQDAVPRPSPHIAVGRVTAVVPIGMIERLDGYVKPLVLDPAQSHAALFVPPDDAVRWSWLEKNLWSPIFTRHYRLQDMTATPPPPGYYRYTGYDVWGPEEVLSELGVSNLTVLATRGDNRCDHTATPREICGRDYGALPLAGGKLYVIAATLSGFSPAFYSPTGSRGSFHSAIPRWLQSVHRTQVGTTWLTEGYNSSVGLSDYLFANFVAQALNGSNATVGDAFVDAWDGYWTASGSGKPDARSVSYAMILWGLPTQPIRHGSASALATAADVRASGLNGDWRNLAGPAAPALDRSFSVEVNVPNFRIDADTTGALLIRPANGGTTYAEGPDLPLVPQVVKRFVLPPNASDIQVTEDTAARVTQSYGAARLQTAELHVDCDGECTHRRRGRSTAATDTYPSQAFDTEIQQRPDVTILTLAAVPAQYARTASSPSSPR